MNKSSNEMSKEWLKENPCYMCNKRTYDCHGYCKYYEKSKEIKLKKKEKIRVQRVIDDETRKTLNRDYHTRKYW